MRPVGQWVSGRQDRHLSLCGKDFGVQSGRGVERQMRQRRVGLAAA